jgi:hypothetical protein
VLPGEVAGFIRSAGMNFINDNGRLTSCSFNSTPLHFTLQ